MATGQECMGEEPEQSSHLTASKQTTRKRVNQFPTIKDACLIKFLKENFKLLEGQGSNNDLVCFILFYECSSFCIQVQIQK